MLLLGSFPESASRPTCLMEQGAGLHGPPFVLISLSSPGALPSHRALDLLVFFSVSCLPHPFLPFPTYFLFTFDPTLQCLVPLVNQAEIIQQRVSVHVSLAATWESYKSRQAMKEDHKRFIKIMQKTYQFLFPSLVGLCKLPHYSLPLGCLIVLISSFELKPSMH